jgi:hypothetical protein
MITEPAYMQDLAFDEPTHIYRYKGVWVPSITGIVPSDYSHVPPHHLERARIRGQKAHKACEDYDLGTIDWSKLQDDIATRLAAWIKAINDYEIEFEPEDIERRLYHPVHRYAGTGDRPRAWIKPPNQKRRLAVLEIKTIAAMDRKDDDLGPVNLQTAGQQCAENYRARELGIPEVGDRWGIQLKKDGSYLAVQYKNKAAERIFLAYLIVIHHQVLTGKFVPRNGGRR